MRNQPVSMSGAPRSSCGSWFVYSDRNSLAKMPEAQRAGAIARWCRRELSARRVSRRLRVFERATAGLRQTCNLLFFTAFVLVPMTYWRFGAELPFVVALAFGGMLMLWIGIEFWCLHKKLYPDQSAERFQLWMLVGVMPQYSIRAVDELSKGFLACAHPLAVAEVFLPEEKFRALRDAVLRDLDFPPPPVLTGEGAGRSLEAAQLFRDDYEKPAVAAITNRRADEAVRCLPDESEIEEGSVKYCPRCLMPYEEAAESCIDCGGIGIVGLEK